MRLDRDRFLMDGYLHLPGFFSPQRVAELRAAFELSLDRQRVIWSQQRGPDDPPGGAWDTNNQPRVLLEQPGLIDASNRLAIEQWVDDQVLEVADLLNCHGDTSLAELVLLCSPTQRDFGPSTWHRDMDSANMAPLQQLIDDHLENGTRLVQWNVPLLDDDVFWLVPGSHRQNDGEFGDRSLSRITTPIPGSKQMRLRAGDVLVYANQILHWGSDYSRTLRRTLIVEHSIFTDMRQVPFREVLGERAARHFAAADIRTMRAERLTELALRSALARDTSGYHAALEALQPGIGAAGKLLFTTYLDKIVNGLAHQHRRDLPEEVWHDRFIGRLHPISLRWGRSFSDRFTAAEVESLHDRFAAYDAALQDPSLPGHRQQNYLFHDVPNLTVDAFTEQWLTSAAVGRSERA